MPQNTVISDLIQHRALTVNVILMTYKSCLYKKIDCLYLYLTSAVRKKAALVGKLEMSSMKKMLLFFVTVPVFTLQATNLK